MESQPQNPEFRNNPENFHPCMQVPIRNLELCFSFQFLPNRCTPVDEDDFFDDPEKQREIFIKKEQLRMISAEDGDTVTMEFKVSEIRCHIASKGEFNEDFPTERTLANIDLQNLETLQLGIASLGE